MYQENLKDLKNIYLPLSKNNFSENLYWVFGIVLKKNCKIIRELICKKLFSKGIETRPFFWPIHQQPIFNGKKKYYLKNAEYVLEMVFIYPQVFH